MGDGEEKGATADDDELLAGAGDGDIEPVGIILEFTQDLVRIRGGQGK